MRYLSYFGLLAGLATLAALLVWQGMAEVLGILLQSGWALLLLPLIWLPNFVPAVMAWQRLFPPGRGPAFRRALAAQWMGRAVNALLPVASIGGELVKARILVLWGAPASDTIASVVVDKTLQVAALLLWGVFGVGLLLYLAIDDGLALYTLAGFSILGVCVAGLLVFQRAGMFGLLVQLGGRLFEPGMLDGLASSARLTDGSVREIYGRRGDVLAALSLRTLQLLIQTGEVWLACWLLGHPIGLVEALLLKSLTFTIAEIAFVIPNAYGVQEGAFIMVGALLGLSPEFALAVSLAVRVRELVIDVPGLLCWQFIEGRSLLTKARAARSAS